MASPEPLDLVVTVVSAKHLKNVNWRNGDLKPYVVLYLDPDHRLPTRSDDSTKPVWNERIALPITRSVHELIFNVEIFHSDSSDLTKTLIGSVRFPLTRLVDSDGKTIPESINSFNLILPSGRPQGKIRLKLAINHRNSIPPPQNSPTPPPPPPRPQSQPPYYYYSSPGEDYYPPPAPIRDPPITSPSSPQRGFSSSPNSFTSHYYSGFYHSPSPPSSMYDCGSNYALPSVHKPPPLAPPSAPVNANEYKPHNPPVGSRLSCYGVPSGLSTPVDYFPSDHSQFKPSYSYGRDHRH